MNRRRLLITTIFCLAVQAAAAISAPRPDLGGQIDPIFAAYAAATPGCAVGVERAGKVLFEKGYGVADVETGRALTSQSRVYMASVSKQVAAMAALLLVEDGRLHLNDPVRKFIPELPAYADAITVAQLLNHTSGIRDYFVLGGLSGFGEDHVYTERGVLDLLERQQALDFAPGSEFLYSNSGYVLISMIVQRVSGQRLDDFARARMFTPLGMTGSRFQHDHTAVIPDKANGYRQHSDRWAASNSNLDVTGDGGLYSSVDDMLKWLANLDRPVVGARALAVMRASARLNDGSPSGYGMGLETSVYRGLELVAHGGALVGYRTADWWFPKAKLGVVVLCNRDDARPGELAARVSAVFLAGEMKAATAPANLAPGVEVGRFAGLYRDPKGWYAEFVARGGELVMLRPEKAALAPTTASGRQFVIASDPDGARLEFGAGGELDLVVREGQPTDRLQRVERIDPGPEMSAAYVGDYTSTEASSAIHIKGGTSLTLSVGDGPAAPLVATGKDRLWMPLPGVELIFLRDAAGKVNGFSLNAGRARGLKYLRSGA